MLIKTLVQRAIKSDRPANVLCYFHDGWFERQLALTGHNIYGNIDGSTYRWEVDCTPDNVKLLPVKMDINLTDRFFDVVICNDRILQYSKAWSFCKTVGLPLIHVDHGSIPTLIPMEKVMEVVSKTSHPETTFVHTTKPAFQWNSTSTYIPTYYPGNTPVEKDLDVLISGRFVVEEYGMIDSVTQAFENVHVIGPNPGLSDKADLEEYYDLFARAKIYISLATDSNLPYGLVTATKSGCAIVSNKMPCIEDFNNGGIQIGASIPEVIKHGKELLNNRAFLEGKVKKCAEIETPDKDDFINSWNEIIESARYRTIIR